MCGRFALAYPKTKIESYYNIEIPFEYTLRFNIAPTDMALTLCTKDKLPSMMHWGFLPFWKKDNSIKEKINSRCETLHKKNMFKQAFKENRCIVIASGYYEWIEERKNNNKFKTPFYITTKLEKPLSIAAIWSRNELRKTPGFSIITTEANDQVHLFHDRMPLILDNMDKVEIWLDNNSKKTDLLGILSQPSHEILKIYEVSRLVNNVKNESPFCLVPVSKI